MVLKNMSKYMKGFSPAVLIVTFLSWIIVYYNQQLVTLLSNTKPVTSLTETRHHLRDVKISVIEIRDRQLC